MSEHKRIWLSPLCACQDVDGRMWCEDPQHCDDCGAEAIEFIRHDIAGAEVALWKGRYEDERHDHELEEENDALRAALEGVMAQAENDLASAHAEICKLQGLEAAQYNWPEWSPQANTLRWFDKLRDEHSIARPKDQQPQTTEDEIKF